MDYHAIGLVEINSIAKGFEVCDAMAKTANVTVLVAKSICPGKYIVMIGGDVAAVRQSVEAGATAGSTIVDTFVIPNIHPSVLPAISGGNSIDKVEAMGSSKRIPSQRPSKQRCGRQGGFGDPAHASRVRHRRQELRRAFRHRGRHERGG